MLLHDTRLENIYNEKLAFRWKGPFWIQKALSEKGTYLLEEMDGATLRGTASGNRLKKFNLRSNEEGPSEAGRQESSPNGEGEDVDEGDVGPPVPPEYVPRDMVRVEILTRNGRQGRGGGKCEY